MDINDERYLEQIRKKLYSRNIISIEEYDAILNFFRKHKEERDIQLLFHNDIPIEIKQHYLEICWEMIQCDPLLIEKMPYGVIYDNNGIINIVRRHPETIKYADKLMDNDTVDELAELIAFDIKKNLGHMSLVKTFKNMIKIQTNLH